MFGTDEIEKRLRMASPSSTNGVRIASYHLLEKAAPSCQLDYTLLHHMRNAGTLSLSLLVGRTRRNEARLDEQANARAYAARCIAFLRKREVDGK